jgi:hypothetical protein
LIEGLNDKSTVSSVLPTRARPESVVNAAHSAADIAIPDVKLLKPQDQLRPASNRCGSCQERAAA